MGLLAAWKERPAELKLHVRMKPANAGNASNVKKNGHHSFDVNGHAAQLQAS